MEEEQQEAQNPRERHAWPLVVVMIVFLAVYFFFPMVLLYPVYRIYGRPYPPQVANVIEIVFYPDIQLDRNVPAYRQLLEWEIDLLGIR